MARIALALVLWAIVDTLFGGYVASAIGTVLDYRVITLQWLLRLVAEAVVAWFLSGPMLVENPPAKSPLITAVLAAVTLYLAVRLAPLVGLNIGFAGVGAFVRVAASLALGVAAFLAVKLWRPRWVLFVALTAITLEFRTGAALGLLLFRLPSWTADAITLAAALVIAAWLSFNDDSPADRAREPNYLWFFGVAGLFAIVCGAEPELVPRFLGGGLFMSRYTLILGWLVFLWTLLAFASRVDPVDSDHPDSPGAGGVALLGVFVALMVFIGLTFGFGAHVSSALPGFEPGPLLVCLLLSAGIMFFMRLFGRIPAEGPGRGMIATGIVLLIAGALGGWRLGSEFLNTGDRAWLGLVVLALLVAPLVVLAQLLTGIGLLRVLFSLQRPLGMRAAAAHLAVPRSAEPEASVPSRPEPGAPTQPSPTPATAQEVAALLAGELRANRMQRVVEIVEQGIAIDSRFFVGYPDDTLALAKRLVAVERADLALRIQQPYLKDHRSHRQHLTNALFAASTLARDPRRLADAARLLEQVRVLYPHEPMVDQLIKSTNRAMAGAPPAK